MQFRDHSSIGSGFNNLCELRNYVATSPTTIMITPRMRVIILVTRGLLLNEMKRTALGTA